MEYKKGDRVKHPTLEDWGLGEVLADSNDDKVMIFFVGVGEKTISLKYVQPVKVTGAESVHPVLENLKTKKSSSGIKYQSLAQSIQSFLKRYQGGFYGDFYYKDEREYKVKGHDLANELLNKEDFSALLKEENYAEITKRALKIVGATNLIFPNEKMSLTDGLRKPEAKKPFSQKLYEFVFGDSDLKNRFEEFAKVLEDIGAAKWTTVSYFPFILMSDKYMFIKPMKVQYSSDLCGFEINYKPELNWLTYKSILDFSNYLKTELSELKPRDMIDIQSFMWCIAPEAE